MKGKMLLVFGLVLVFAFALPFTVSSATETPDFPLTPSALWSGNDVGATSGDVRAVVVGDLDHDGDDDVASGDTSGNIIVWQNDGTPFTSLWISNTVGNCGAGPDVYSLALGDFDNNGDLDLASGCDTIVVWENDGTPFSGEWTANTAGTGEDTFYAVALADLDGDGDLDMISDLESADATDYQVTAWQNDGTPLRRCPNWAGSCPFRAWASSSPRACSPSSVPSTVSSRAPSPITRPVARAPRMPAMLKPPSPSGSASGGRAINPAPLRARSPACPEVLSPHQARGQAAASSTAVTDP